MDGGPDTPGQACSLCLSKIEGKSARAAAFRCEHAQFCAACAAVVACARCGAWDAAGGRPLHGARRGAAVGGAQALTWAAFSQAPRDGTLAEWLASREAEEGRRRGLGKSSLES